MVPYQHAREVAMSSVEDTVSATDRARRIRFATVSTSTTKALETRKPSMSPTPKPSKVNSEARKEQNRIASRNYREKRKRKLQYLQQLLENDASSSNLDSTTGSPEPPLGDLFSLGIPHDVSPNSRPALLSPSPGASFPQLGPTPVTMSYHQQPVCCPPMLDNLDSTWAPAPYVDQSFSGSWAQQPWIPSMPYYPREPYSQSAPPMMSYQQPMHQVPELSFNVDDDLTIAALSVASGGNTSNAGRSPRLHSRTPEIEHFPS